METGTQDASPADGNEGSSGELGGPPRPRDSREFLDREVRPGEAHPEEEYRELSRNYERTLQSPQDPARTQPPATASPNDAILATWLLIENSNEISLAELAAQRAENPEVKQFAQKLIADRRRVGQNLEPFASPSSLRAATGTEGGGGASDAQPREAASQQKPASSELDPVSLLRELGAECRMSARKELEQKQGGDFDQCFLGMTIGGHRKVNDELRVFQRHASPDLKSVMTERLKTVEMHLAQAKDLGKKLMAERMGAPKK
jgi:predicted outer membrane protein